MRVARPEPLVAVVEDRPVLVPGFCLVFLIVGVFQFVGHTTHGSWNVADGLGVLLALVLGGGGFLYTARRDAYRFDGRTKWLEWTRRGLLGRSSGRLPFDAIEDVLTSSPPSASILEVKSA